MLDYQGHNIPEIADIDLNGKNVFLRADFNVDVAQDNSITDDYRLRAVLPTIAALFERGARAIIIASHLGRPQGRFDPALSLMPVAAWMQGKTGWKTVMAEDTTGPSARKLIDEAKEGSIIFLENLRFDAREEQNDALFAKELASLADVYVNDAFGASHRAHASVAVITQFLPSCAGLLLASEIRALEMLVANPKPPLIALIGGAKITDKISVIEALAKTGYSILIGGALANTFLKAKGTDVGASVYAPEEVDTAGRLLSSYPNNLVLPEDTVVSNSRILDIGEQTAARYAQTIKNAKTVVWAGPLGYYEDEAFQHGTKTIARACGESQAYRVAGGGDTIAVINELRVAANFDHISTGGSAMLEFLAGKPMPALEALVKIKQPAQI